MVFMKKVLFGGLCVLTALSVLCTIYIIFDYISYSTAQTEEKISGIEKKTKEIQKNIDNANIEKQEFLENNKEKVGMLDLWEEEKERIKEN